MAQAKATLSARTNKGSPASLAPKATKASRSVVDRKPTSKAASLPEKRIVRASDLQNELAQVKEHLKKVKEDKSKVVRELEQVNKTLSESDTRIQVLEEDVNRTKASERKMLESMVSQTKLLEETKMELEEAKLHARALQRTIQNMESSEGWNGKNGRQSEEKLMNAREEIKQLKIQLQLAAEAEEKSEGTMGDLAAALTEVATEAKQMKEKFQASESELDSLRGQADSTKSILSVTQEKLRSALEESSRSKTESEELLAAWDKKQNELRVRIQVLEEEVAWVKQENSTLIEKQRASSEEISKLREELKNSASEASIVNEALEKARNENSELKHTLLEQGNSLQTGGQEHLGLDASMTSSYVECRDGSPDMNAPFKKSTSVVKEARYPNSVRTLRWESWRNEEIGTENGSKESGACSGCLEDSTFTMIGSSENENDQMLASISSDSEHDDGLTTNADEFQHVDGSQLGEMQSCRASPDKKTKKQQMFRKLGVMLKGKKIHQ